MSLVGFKALNHPQQIATDEVDDRGLPHAEFWVLNQRFNFTVDVAAAPHNAKLSRFYTRQDDGLAKSWSGERVYCNPPFSKIRRWIEKAWLEDKAEVIVLLLPANRTEQGWWQDLIESRRDREGSPLKVEFLPTRIRFYRPGEVMINSNNRPRFGCCLCIWDNTLRTK